MTIIILAFLVLGAFAGDFKYKVSGSYLLAKESVPFELSWNEQNSKITGVFSDTHAKQVAVQGVANELGRTFKFSLPTNTRNLSTVTMMGPASSGATLPLAVIAQNAKGEPLVTQNVNAIFTQALVAQKQEENPCEELGPLSLSCGTYSGMVAEESDSTNSCQLVSASRMQLELIGDGSVVLLPEGESEIVNTTALVIGRIPALSDSTSIDVMSRSCRPIPGVNFRGDDCKRLNVRGTFTQVEGRHHFRGHYIVVNERTNSFCHFTLSMDKRD